MMKELNSNPIEVVKDKLDVSIEHLQQISENIKLLREKQEKSIRKREINVRYRETTR